MWAGQGQHRPMETIVHRVDYTYKLKLTYRYIVGALTVLIVRTACGTVVAASKNSIASKLGCVRCGLRVCTVWETLCDRMSLIGTQQGRTCRQWHWMCRV